jgi:hypothetical protein
MSTLEPKEEKKDKRGGKRKGVGRKRTEETDKVKQENLKVRLSSLYKARAISKMAGGKVITKIIDEFLTSEYLRLCKVHNIEPETYPNTLRELEEYKLTGKISPKENLEIQQNTDASQSLEIDDITPLN